MHTDTPTCTETEKVPLMQTVSISRMNKASPKARTCAEYFSSTRAACEPRVSLLSLGLMDHHGHETPGLELLHPLCREPPAASQPGHFHTHQGQIRATSEPDQGHIRARSGPDQGQIRARSEPDQGQGEPDQGQGEPDQSQGEPDQGRIRARSEPGRARSEPDQGQIRARESRHLGWACSVSRCFQTQSH